MLKLLEEKGERNLEYMGTGDHFLNIRPIAQTERAKIKKWYLLKLRSFFNTKYTVIKTNSLLTDWQTTHQSEH